MKIVDAIDAIPIKNDFTGEFDFELSIESGGRVYPFKVTHEQIADFIAQLGKEYSTLLMKECEERKTEPVKHKTPSHPRGGTSEPKLLVNQYEAVCAVCSLGIQKNAQIFWHRTAPGKGNAHVWHSLHGQYPDELEKLFV